MYVVITRDAEDGGRFARALGPRFEAVFLPVTAVAPATDDELARLYACAADLDGYQHLFVASRHAVPPLVAALSAAARDPVSAPPVTAVGPATAAALTAAGFHARAEGDTGEVAAASLAARLPRASGPAASAARLPRASGSAASLAARLPRASGSAASRGASPRILAPRAAGGRDEPLALLRAAGAEVDDVIAYRTRPAVPDAPEVAAGLAALRAGAAACLLFAPSQVAALAALLADGGGLPALARTPLIAIGPTTAAALAAHGVAAAAVAASPTPEAMANALTSVYPDLS